MRRHHDHIQFNILINKQLKKVNEIREPCHRHDDSENEQTKNKREKNTNEIFFKQLDILLKSIKRN